MEASASAPSELSLLLQLVLRLPPETHDLVLRHLPAVELARLSCVHKAFRDVWRCLREQYPGPRYAAPSAEDVYEVWHRSRLERAAAFGDMAVIRSMVFARVDEHGTPLMQARNRTMGRVMDMALRLAAERGHDRVVTFLFAAGANVRADGDKALIFGSARGHAAVVQLLLCFGANVLADDERALRLAS